MRIDSKNVIAGYEALKVRALLRRTAGMVSIPFTCRVMHSDEEAARALIGALEQAGYIEKDPRGHDWSVTVKGSAFAMASAGPALKRATADKILLEFLSRVEQLRDEPHWCFKVERVVLFGSYLSDAPTLGDVDVAISLRRAHADPKIQEAAKEQRRTDAQNAGRDFQTFFARLYWPENEVRQLLSARRLSLHDLVGDLPVVEAGAHVTIYEDERVRHNSIPILAGWSNERSALLRETAHARKAVAAEKRKAVALRKSIKEKEEILAQVERLKAMSTEELDQHRDEIKRLAIWVSRNTDVD
jgi:hypothetical protein